MLTLAISNYRSIRDLVMPLGALNLVTGANGSGKSNLYRAWRLLAERRQAALDEAIEDAFAGAKLAINAESGWFSLELTQHGLLRPLRAAELSDGTLRYLLWIAALLTPRPPALMVLNEPETSLHPDLLPALAKLIRVASGNTQIWIIGHATRLIAALLEDPNCMHFELHKELGQTRLMNQRSPEQPPWKWPTR